MGKRNTVIRSISAVYSMAVLVLGLKAGEPDRMDWWPGGLLMMAMMASPIVLGLLLSRKIGEGAALGFWLFAMAIIAAAGLALQWYTMFIGPSDAQNALVLVIVPVLQWLAVGAAFALAWILGRYVDKS